MSAISYTLSLSQLLNGSAIVNSVPSFETVVPSTNAPAAGSIELRFDQTAGAITDAAYSGGTRPLKKGEVQALLRILEEYLIHDSNVFQA
jgi:hypothetical protein